MDSICSTIYSFLKSQELEFSGDLGDVFALERGDQLLDFRIIDLGLTPHPFRATTGPPILAWKCTDVFSERECISQRRIRVDMRKRCMATSEEYVHS